MARVQPSAGSADDACRFDLSGAHVHDLCGETTPQEKAGQAISRLGIALLVLATACTPIGIQSTNTTRRPTSGDLVGEVTWISDGDTIDVTTDQDETIIRLAGINAPDKGECYAEESRDHLINTLKGDIVTLEILDTDQFGRTLAHVFVGDRHVNIELVEMGLAIANGVDDDPYGDDLAATEQDAYESGTGLWGETSCGSTGELPELGIDRNCSEVDPSGADDERLDQERICISNTGDSEIDLAGWILRDESTRHRYTFSANSSLASGEGFVVTSADPGWDPGGGPVWNNGGDLALLQLPDGTVVDRWRY